MTLEQLKKKAEFWCELLGVEDLWDVSVGIGDTGNLEGLCGKNTLVPEQQISKILIAPGETEETLVHEILHIIFDGFKSSEDWKYNPLHELAINKVSYALVDLANVNKKKKNGKQTTAKSTTSALKSKNSKQPRKERHITASASSPPPVRVSKHAVPAGNQVCSRSLRD